MSIDDIRNTQSDEVGEGGTKHKRRKIYMNGNIKHRPRTSRIFTPFRVTYPRFGAKVTILT